MTITSETPTTRLTNSLHHAVLMVLIVARPLIWDGEPGQPAALAWYVLVAIGLFVLAGDIIIGLRRTWTWSPVGILAAVAVTLLIPAGLHSPQAFNGLSDLGQLLGHLAFAVYVSQAISGRERTAIAALLTGLGLEACYAFVQQFVVLPAFEQDVLSGKDIVGVNQFSRGDLVERIRNGGVYGTFTVSNSLAGYLLLVIPLAIGAITLAATSTMRTATVLLAVAGLGVLACTNSKGAWIAAIIASAFVALRRAPGRWRGVIPAAVALGMAVVIFVPTLRQHVSASADVRLGYWHAATALIAEHPWTGHGIGGFAAEAPRVLAIGAEYSRHIHNEVLEAAVAGGIVAGLVVAVFFLSLMFRRAQTAPLAQTPSPSWLAAVIAPALIYLHIFGLLPAGGFPGCVNDINLLFILPFAVGAAAIFACVRQVEIPRWSIELALAAAVLHYVQDFDLRSGGVLGALAVVVCLSAPGRTITIPRISALFPGLTAVALCVGLMYTLTHSTSLHRAQLLVDQVEALDHVHQRGKSLEEAISALHQALGLPEPNASELSPQHAAHLRSQAVALAWESCQAAPAPAEVTASVISLSPPSRERLQHSSTALNSFPHSALLHALLSEDLAAAEQWHEALAASREAVRRNPWHLIYRLRLVALLERCAAAKGDPDLLAEARREHEKLRELNSLVHPRDRLPAGSL